MLLLAAIDAGSNAIRMLVAGYEKGQIKRLRYERTTTRLAAGFSSKGKTISPESMEDTVSAFRKYSGILSGLHVCRMRAVGTSALREAANSGELLERVLRETGIGIDIIPEQKEAELSAKGVLRSLDLDRALILDIGGGSTEWTLARGKKAAGSGSFPVGVVKLAGLIKERGVEEGTEAAGKEAAMLARKLGEAAAPLPRGTTLVLTGGTGSTLASIDAGLARYEHEKIHGRVLPLARLKDICGFLTALSPEQRKNVRGLEPDRADLIIPGIRLTINIMEFLAFEKVKISDTGLPEGIISELAEDIPDETEERF
ncbi:MAG: hypothetical protein M0Z59_03505 [Nitrospiraceae bacterium]|nr:hypothetical protein [Nitrospiraceae bacterium]